VGKLGNEVGCEADEGVGVGSWIGEEAQLQLGLESGVVVGGFDKSGEDVIGRGGVLEKSKFGNVDWIVGKVGGEVGWACKPSFELGFEFEEVGRRGGSVLCSHSLHDDRNCHRCHPKNRVGDESTIGRADGLEEDGAKFRHSNLMGVESFQLSLVCTDEGIGGGTDGGDGHGPRWCRADDHWSPGCARALTMVAHRALGNASPPVLHPTCVAKAPLHWRSLG
jgi:hypothetical protein